MKTTPSILSSNEYTTMTALAVVVGLVAGFGAIGFRYLLDAVQIISYGSKGSLIELVISIPWLLKILIPAIGGLVVGPLVYFFAREAKGHGVPEVMEAVAGVEASYTGQGGGGEAPDEVEALEEVEATEADTGPEDD